MPTPPLTKEQCERAYFAVLDAMSNGFKLYGTPSAKEEAARRIDVGSSGIKRRLDFGVKNGWFKLPSSDSEIPPPGGNTRIEYGESPTNDLPSVLRRHMTKGPHSLAQLVQVSGASLALVLDAIGELQQSGVNVVRRGDSFEIVNAIEPAFASKEPLVFVSRPDNTFCFGVAGDKHIGSKYHRADVLADLYREFGLAGVQACFDTGNWIDGECGFNRYDIDVHGLDAQCRRLAETHPAIEGVKTYSVWGDDHEGWYAAREGIDVGAYCESVFRSFGRDDWINLGYMEAHVILRNANTGTDAVMAVVHPGGGSSYALSYRPQKIIESLEGGAKPGVILLGHYHKLDPGNVRNVWYLQTGCVQDQTPFMRKKSIEAHVGGAIVTMTQDPETGAITRFRPDMIRYFHPSYYARSGRMNNMWSRHGAVSPPPRMPGRIS